MCLLPPASELERGVLLVRRDFQASDPLARSSEGLRLVSLLLSVVVVDVVAGRVSQVRECMPPRCIDLPRFAKCGRRCPTERSNAPGPFGMRSLFGGL
jgi:hypothetical protein